MFKIKKKTNLSVSPKEDFGTSKEEISKFINESRECQYLYAKIGGSSDRIQLDVEDKDLLENTIDCILFNNDHVDRATFRPEDKTLMIKKVVGGIINLSQKFDTPGEVHFSVIWVHYFIYEKKTAEATPLFKVYKMKHSEEAGFLDVDLNTFDGWKNYLDKAKLPMCLMCVPRRGTYVFGDELHKLDYLFYGGSNGSRIRTIQYSPFYDKFIRSMPHKFKQYLNFCLENKKILIIIVIVATAAIAPPFYYKWKPKSLCLMVLGKLKNFPSRSEIKDAIRSTDTVSELFKSHKFNEENVFKILYGLSDSPEGMFISAVYKEIKNYLKSTRLSNSEALGNSLANLRNAGKTEACGLSPVSVPKDLPGKLFTSDEVSLILKELGKRFENFLFETKGSNFFHIVSGQGRFLGSLVCLEDNIWTLYLSANATENSADSKTNDQLSSF